MTKIGGEYLKEDSSSYYRVRKAPLSITEYVASTIHCHWHMDWIAVCY